MLRIFDAATDAGAIDVYVTDPATDLSTVTSPTFTFLASTNAQSGVFLSFTPGTYRVRVVGLGNIADVRLDIPAVVLANQQLATVFLTPTTGGTLANGGVLLQQGAYTATHNTSARIRLAAAVSNSAAVSVSAGASAVGSGVISPAVGAYTTVDSGSALNITVNGQSVAAPAGTLAAGSDSTLVVYGNASAPTTNLITDDNHIPTTSTNYKIRLINGLTSSTGTPPPLTLDVNFAPEATNILAGMASSYAVIGASHVDGVRRLLAVFGGADLHERQLDHGPEHPRQRRLHAVHPGRCERAGAPDPQGPLSRGIGGRAVFGDCTPPMGKPW